MKERDEVKAPGQVIDLAKEKRKRLVLDAFDRLDHQDRREKAEQRAEIERTARGKL